MLSFFKWIPVDAVERTFLGLVLHMDIVKKPEIRQYWSVDVLYSIALYPMAGTHFKLILKCLHYI